MPSFTLDIPEVIRIPDRIAEAMISSALHREGDEFTLPEGRVRLVRDCPRNVNQWTCTTLD
jgi:hypothetical protein